MSNTLLILSFLLSGLLLSACDFSEASRKRVLDSMKATLEKGDDGEKLLVAEVHSPTGTLFAGQTEEEVVKITGKPSGRMTLGKKTVLTYCGETLILDDGKLRTPDPNFFEKIKANKIAALNRAKIEKQQALLRKPEPVKRLAAVPKQTPAAAPAYSSPKHIYADLLTPGRITVVDFYADWCGPCRQLAPILAEIEHRHRDAVFTKINIQDWGSKIANKYHITSVPRVMVFDANGNMVGQPTSTPNQIVQNILRAQQAR